MKVVRVEIAGRVISELGSRPIGQGSSAESLQVPAGIQGEEEPLAVCIDGEAVVFS